MSTRALNASARLRAGVLVPAFLLVWACSAQSDDTSSGAGGSASVGSTGSGSIGSSGSAGGGSIGSSGSAGGGTSSSSAGASSGGAGSGSTAASSGGGADSGSTAASTSGAGGGGVVPTGDPLDILREFTPADEELAEAYEGYITDEVGPLTYATEGTGTARTISQTLFVPPNAVYDGKGETLSADVAAMKCDTSSGEQGESQRPFFLLAPGASVKNVTITYPGCEGIHMMGDNVLENITWEDVGEDAASVRSYFPGGSITIKDSEAFKAADKMFQFNAPCDVRIENFTGAEMGKLLRQNGGTEFELNIDLNTVTVTGVVSAVVQSDSPLCFIRHHNLTYEFTGSGDKSDRVFRDVPPENITEY
ncbi:pectate lyase [Sorangium sp. So ce1078]|uniref:pectate lyase n=1 Tax=Sorangium sp. So ce1078 TaxID=3133329 RepID=UPI003F62C786